METIGERAVKEIKNRARKNGIALYKEGQKIGASSRVLFGWKEQNGNPSAYYLQQMAIAGYDVIYILTGERNYGKT